MAKRELKHCNHCGAKMVEYKHSLNSGLAVSLSKLIKHGKPAALKELGLTVSQFNNFQKLQYWNFVEKTHDNLWQPTSLAKSFFRGVPAPKSVWTYRGDFVRNGDEFITIDNLRSDYRKK